MAFDTSYDVIYSTGFTVMLKCISAPEAADPTNAWRLFPPVFRKAYYMNAAVYIGEILDCEIEPENDYDKYAVAVLVGHVPIELSKIFYKFLSQYGQIEAKCIGSRFNTGQGKGLELPIDFRLLGNARYLRKVMTKLQKEQKRKDTDWRISDLRKSDAQD